MRLTEQSIHDVIHPTAAFSAPDLDSAIDNALDENPPWEVSSTNPKNRINSLDLVANASWRIDGCTAFGTQFYAVPLFVNRLIPSRLDVFIPEPGCLSAELREVLDAAAFFHTKEPSKIAHLGLTRHVLRILQHWTSTFDDPREIYKDAPFGSRIVIDSLPKDVTKARVYQVPTHYLERQLLSVSALQAAWGASMVLPPSVDLEELRYISQPHDSVSIVEYSGRQWALKALTSYTKYMFHELRDRKSVV